jgi:cysteine sulfinate desulfinase/cysteine desulfurase-like protein
VHLANLVRLASVEEDALGGGGLASVDVGHDADVAVHGQIHVALCCGACHAHRCTGIGPWRQQGLDIQSLHHGAHQERGHRSSPLHGAAISTTGLAETSGKFLVQRGASRNRPA